MASGPDQSSELSVLDNDDGRVSTDSPQDIWEINCTIRAFWSFAAWIMHSHTTPKYV